MVIIRQMKKYKESEMIKKNLFIEESLEEVGLKGHEAEARAWNLAWSRGHSSGMDSVLSELEELAEVILG